MGSLPVVGGKPADAPDPPHEALTLAGPVLAIAGAVAGTRGHVFAGLVAERLVAEAREVRALVEGPGAAERLQAAGVTQVQRCEVADLAALEASTSLLLVVGPTLATAVRSRLLVIVGADRPLPAWRAEARALRGRRAVWLADPRPIYAAGLAALCSRW